MLKKTKRIFREIIQRIRKAFVFAWGSLFSKKKKQPDYQILEHFSDNEPQKVNIDAVKRTEKHREIRIQAFHDPKLIKTIEYGSIALAITGVIAFIFLVIFPYFMPKPTLSATTNKSDFSANQNPTFTLDTDSMVKTENIKTGSGEVQAGKSKITATVNQDGKPVDVKPVITSDGSSTDKFNVSVPEADQIKPGKYQLKVDIKKDRKTLFFNFGKIEQRITQDFTWGVLAINPDKAVYNPGEEAFIAMAVLDDKGKMDCAAKVILEIVGPDEKTDILSTENKKILISKTCATYNGVITVPDYYASYKPRQNGQYKLKLYAETRNGKHSIEDGFLVKEDPAFEIQRNAQTRIYPVVKNKMQVIIVPNTSFSGLIQESVPTSFEITPGDFTVQKIDNHKVITWNKSVKIHEPLYLEYEYKAPEISPEFYVLGPLKFVDSTSSSALDNEKIVYQEPRQWQIAADQVANMILWFVGSTPADWTNVSASGQAFYQKFIEGAATYNASPATGADTHTHTTPGTLTLNTTGTGGYGGTVSGGTSTPDNATHTHTGSPVTGGLTASNMPDYRNLKVIKYNYGIPSDLPTGAVVMFDSSYSGTTYPSGWADLFGGSNYAYLRGADVTSLGTFTAAASQVHTLTFGASVNIAGTTAKGKNAGYTIASSTHTHGLPNLTVTPTTQQPPYINTKFGQKSSGSGLPANMIAMFDNAPPTSPADWTTLSGSSGVYENKYPKGASSYNGAGGGASTHDHTGLTQTTNSLTGTAVTSASGTTFSTNAHTHITAAFSLDAQTNQPAHVEVIIAKLGSAASAAAFDETHVRWRNDDGTNETDATNPVAEDIKYTTYPNNGQQRLRMQIKNTGGVASNATYTLQYAQTATCASGSYTNVGTGADSYWNMALTSKYADADSSTNVAGLISDPTGDYFGAATYTNNALKESSPTVSPTSKMPQTTFVEMEFSIKPASTSVSGDYCFRINPSAGTPTYTNYAAATVTAVFTISGTSDSGMHNGDTIKVAINGAVDGAHTGTINTSTNTWSITETTVASGNSVIVFVVDATAAYQSTAISVYGGSGSMTGMVLNANILSIGSANSSAIAYTNADDFVYSGSGDNQYVMHTATTSALTVDANNRYNEKLDVLASNTLNIPNSGTLTTYDLSINGTLSSGTSTTISVAHNFTNNSTFTQSTSTVDMNGSTAQIINGSATTTFNNLTVSNTGAAITVNPATTNSMVVSGTFTVNASAIVTPNAATIISGAGTLTGSGTVQVSRTASTADFGSQYSITNKTLTSLTVEYTGVSQALTSTTYGNLKISANSISTGAGTATVGGVFTVGASGVFTPSSGTTTFNTGASIVNSGTLTFQGITIANSATVTTSSNFSIAAALTVGTSGVFAPAGTTTFTGGSIANSGTLTFTGVTFNGTTTNSTNSTITIGGALTVGASGNYSPSNGTTTFSGGSIANSGTLAFNNVTFNGTTTNTTNSTITVNGAFSVGGSGNYSPTTGTTVMATNSWSIANAGGTLALRTLTINETPSSQSNANFSVLGMLTVAASKTLAPTGGTITMSGTGWGITNNNVLTFQGLKISGTPSAQTGASFSIAATLTVDNTFTFAPTGGTITCNNGATIINNGTLTFQGLTIADSATVGTSGSFSAVGNLTIGSSSIFNPDPATVVSGSGTLTGTGTARVSRIASTADFNSQYSISNKTLTNLTVEYYGTDSQTISALTYNNLKITPQANSKTWTFAAGSPRVTGTFTMSNGTSTSTIVTAAPNSTILDVDNDFTIPDNTTFVANASNNLTIGGNFTETGTGAFTHSSGTVVFDAGDTGNTINSGSDFNSVIFNNANGGWSFSATTTIAGNLTVTTSETAGNGVNLNNQTIGVTGNVAVNGGKLTAGSAAINVAGNWTNAATFTASTSTVTFNGSVNQVITPGGQSFNNLTLNNTGTTPGTNDKLIVSGNLTANADFTLTDGTFDLDTNDPVIQLGNDSGTGNITFNGGNIINSSAGSNFILNDNPTEFDDKVGITLGNVVIGQSPATTNLKSDMSASSLTVSAGDNYNTRGWEVDIGTGSISIAGNFNTTDTGGANYDTSDGSIVTTEGNFTISGSGTFTKDSGTYKSLVKPDGGATKTFTSLSQDMGDVQISVASTHIDLQNDLNADSVTIDTSTTLDSNGYDITCGGNWAKSGTFTQGVKKVTFDGTDNSTGQTVSGNTTFYDLTIDPTGSVPTTYKFTAGSTTTISHTWTVTGADSNLVAMTSTNTSEWNVQPAAATVDYANVDYSNSNLYICATHSTDGGHNNVNGNWQFTLGTSCNAAPNDPTDLAQKKTTDVVIATGGWTNETTVPARSVKFTATVSDTDSDQVKICVEKQPIATAFTGTEDGCGSLVASGGIATYTISGHTDATEYHWQVKAVDEHSASSNWVSYGANTENPPTNPAARDYGIDTTAPTGLTVYDGTETGVQHDYNDGSIVQLSANWTAADFGASGSLTPNRYKYSIGTTVGGIDIKALTDIDTTSVTAGSISIHTGQIYYFTVKAYDNAGNITTISSTGQQVLPTFTVSLDSYDVDIGTWEDPTFLGAGSNTITTTTNAYHGYLVYLYKTDDYLHLETDIATTIANIVADWTSPAAWPGSGFGYTSNDTSVQGSNRFNNGTYYAYIPTRDGTTNPGDIVADETTPQTSGQEFMITYKVQTSATQAAGRYTTNLVYTVVPEY